MRFLIIGQGIAGTAMAFSLLEQGHEVVVYKNPEYREASRVASGLWNPVVLKRMSLVWKGLEMLEDLEEFYPRLEEFTQSKFYYPQNIYRLLHHAGEANDWLGKSAEPQWEKLLKTPLLDAPKSLHTQIGQVGELTRTGWVNTRLMLDAFEDVLMARRALRKEAFHYEKLEAKNAGYEYQGDFFDKVIFAEGYRAEEKNPYFPKDVFRPTKGVVLTVKCPDLQLEKILHFTHFVIPMGQNTYRLGATYDWKNLDEIPDEEAIAELMESLQEIHKGEIKLIEAKAGIRPNTKDRKPIIGSLEDYTNLYFMNGLGSRGILMAPYLVKHMNNHIFQGENILKEISVKRFCS